MMTRPTRDTWWLIGAWASVLATALLFWAVIAFIAWDIFR